VLLWPSLIIAPCSGASGPHVIYASLGPPESITQNCISIGSAVFAQLTAECCYTLHRAAPLPLIITPSQGGYGPPSNTWFLGPIRAHNPKGISIQFRRFCTGDCTTGCPFPHKIAPSHGCGGCGPQSNNSSLGPPESSTQTASRSLEPFLQSSLVWQTDRPHYSVGNNRPPFMYIVRYDDMIWTILTCAQKLTRSQLSLPHGTKQKRIMKKLKT